MSNQQHTPEPWATEEGEPGTDCFYIVDPAGNVAIAKVFNYKLQGVGGINARRIVACVNACVGISTENLEDNKPIIELAKAYNEALRQRDELLSAAEYAIEWMLQHGLKHKSAAVPYLRCAIASVKGGAK